MNKHKLATLIFFSIFPEHAKQVYTVPSTFSSTVELKYLFSAQRQPFSVRITVGYFAKAFKLTKQRIRNETFCIFKTDPEGCVRRRRFKLVSLGLATLLFRHYFRPVPSLDSLPCHQPDRHVRCWQQFRLPLHSAR